MEQVVKQNQQVQNQQQPRPFSMTYALSLGWTNDEVRIWDLQYNSRPIKFFKEESLSPHIRALVFKINVVTGWAVPELEEQRRVLYDQFQKKLIEDYSSLNMDEIEYAIRSYGTKIKDWGKAINLSMVEEVLTAFIAHRAQVRRLEESHLQKELPTAQAEPLNWPEYLETVKSTFLKTKIPGLIPAEIYHHLVQEKEIDLTVEEKRSLFERMKGRLENEALANGKAGLHELRDLKENRDKYNSRLRQMCYQQSVADYFTMQNNIDNF